MQSKIEDLGTTTPVRKPPGRRTAVAAVVTGLVALLATPTGVGLPVGCLALVLGIVSLSRGRRHGGGHRGLAIVGVVTGVVAVVTNLLVLVVLVFSMGDLSQYADCIRDADGDAVLEDRCDALVD